jgi:hypothetical protein
MGHSAAAFTAPARHIALIKLLTAVAMPLLIALARVSHTNFGGGKT